MSTEQESGQHRRSADFAEFSEENDQPKKGSHAAPDGAQRHPLIDLSRDPNPGVPDHAKSEDD